MDSLEGWSVRAHVKKTYSVLRASCFGLGGFLFGFLLFCFSFGVFCLFCWFVI